MELFVFQLLNGLSSAMFIWLIAAGLTIAFGVLGILNMAQGSLYMLGMFISYTFYWNLGMNFALSVVLTLISVGICGFLLERLFLRRVYALPLEFQLILTFAFVYILQDAVRLGWAPVLLQVPLKPHLLGGNITIPIISRAYPIYNLFLITAGIAVFAIVWLILDKTWWGKAVRATASDREMANAIGINIRTLFSAAFIFAAMITAIGGALAMPFTSSTCQVGAIVIPTIFVVTAVGTLGNLKGAFIAALVIGVVGSYVTFYFPFMELFTMFAILAIVLIIRPHGIFGGG